MNKYVVGMGCRKSKDPKELEEYFFEVLKQLDIDIIEVISLVSIDVKKEEEAFVLLSDKYNIPFITYSAQELADVEGDFEKSEFVKNTVGVSDVSARAAKACGIYGEFVLKKDKRNGMTISVFKIDELEN